MLPCVIEFKYLGVLYTSKGKVAQETDMKISTALAVMQVDYQTGEGAKPEEIW